MASRKSRTKVTNPSYARPIGALPEDLSVQILKLYGADEQTDLQSLLRSTEASMGQIAAVLVADCYEGRWRGRMGFDTASRIKLMAEHYFTPPAGEPVDPVAESAQRGHNERDPWLRHEEIHDPRHVTVLGGSGDLGIQDGREGRS